MEWHEVQMKGSFFGGYGRLVVALGVVGAALVSSGCYTALRQAIERGEAASARGDLLGAAVAFRDACQLDPSDAELCARSRQATRAAVDGAVAQARPLCAAGDVAGCLAAIKPVRVFGNDPAIGEILDQAGWAHAQGCASAPLDSPEAAVVLVRCLESRSKELPTASYRDRIREGRMRAADLLVQRARASADRHPGSASALLGAAACLDGEASTREKLEAATSRFLEKAQLPVSIEVKVPGGPPPVELAALCQTARGKLPATVRCDGSAKTVLPKIGISIDLDLKPLAHEVTDTVREVRYLARTDLVRNPDHAITQRDLRHDRRAAERLQNELAVARADCETAQSLLARANYCTHCQERAYEESTCNRAEALRLTYNERVDAYNDGVDQLNRTPAVVQQNVYETFRYVEHHHRWEAPLSARFDVRGARAAAPFTDSATVRFERVEHVGFEPAGLEAAPRRDPTPSEVHQLVADRLVEQISRLVGTELGARARDQLSACGAPPATLNDVWLECWAEATFWSSGELVKPFLALLGERVRREGKAPYPPAPCLQ